MGFGISSAIWSTMLHDLVDSTLGVLRIIEVRWYDNALNSPTPWRTLLWCQMSP